MPSSPDVSGTSRGTVPPRSAVCGQLSVVGWAVGSVPKAGTAELDPYLVAHRMSSGSGIQEYKRKLSVHDLPTDVIEHIYWVNPDSSKKLLYPEYLR